MRSEFASAICALGENDPRVVFLTGDLGYRALEQVRNVLGSRFINAGVAEQNMVSVAAGLAREGFLPIVYSIAPFVVLRAFEQIRNDVCFHDLDVKIVGNGGGYGYGIMGCTHHLLEDLAFVRLMTNMSGFIPGFSQDVFPAVQKMLTTRGPAYLRLNLGIKSLSMNEPFAPWRRLAEGNACVVIACGPVVESLLEEIKRGQIDSNLCEIWLASEFPLRSIPDGILRSLKMGKNLVSIEEHRQAGGLGENVLSILSEKGIFPRAFKAHFASGYPSGRYGSQRWHLEENGLAGESLVQSLKIMCSGIL